MIISQRLRYNAPDQAPQSTPVCFGTCPSGTMTTRAGTTLGYLTLEYMIPGAIQKSFHPNPNHAHSCTRRRAYLPDTTEARDILFRFQFAFLHGLSFEVGQSLTSGLGDQVRWSLTLPHKSCTTGGPQYQFGFPDPAYLPVVSRAFDQLHVPKDPQICRQWILQHQHSAFVAPHVIPSGPPVAAAAWFGMAPQGSRVPYTGRQPLGRNENETIYYDADMPGDNDVDRYIQCLVPVVNGNEGETEKECAICLDDMTPASSADTTNVVCLKNCKHRFHQACIIAMLKLKHTRCPFCREPIGIEPHGSGPSGTLHISIDYSIRCRGSEHDSDGVIILMYNMPGGTQTTSMESPGQYYYRTDRVAFVPHNESGRALLKRLKYSFTHGLTFRVGTSLTTGRPNQITWTSIHHKTSLNFGGHGYPDPQYFANCNGALDALHVPKAEDCP